MQDDKTILLHICLKNTTWNPSYVHCVIFYLLRYCESRCILRLTKRVTNPAGLPMSFSPISSSLPSPINSMLVWINALQAVLAILKNDKKLIPPPRSHVRQGPHTELTLSILCHLHHELWYLVLLGLRFNISLQNPILYISPRCVTINHKMLWIPRAQSYHLTATGAWYS